MQHFRDSVKYGTMAYVKCLDDMAKQITEMGVEATVLILVEARAPFEAPASST